MKVLQINAVYEFSSTGKLVKELHEYLEQSGVNSYLAVTNIKNDNKNFIKIGNIVSYKLHAFMSRLVGRQAYFSFYATKKLIKKINIISPDVIHLHNLHSNYINLPILLKHLGSNNISTVITLHDCWFFTGHCCYFTDSNCNKWMDTCGKCPEIHRWNKSWFFDFSRENIEDKKKYFSGISKLAVIGVSEWITNIAKQSILKDSYIVKRIYNWIDIDVFKPIDTSNKRIEMNLTNEFVVLGVSQGWNLAKGIYDFIKIAILCPNFKFILVGDIHQIKESLPSNIISVGAIQKLQNLIEYYSMADVFLNLSLRETFGMVTIESLACGTPVVAYDTTATTELVPEGCGFKVALNDYKSVIKYINIIKMYGKDTYTNNCCSYVRNNFKKEDLLENYFNLYKKLKNNSL